MRLRCGRNPIRQFMAKCVSLYCPSLVKKTAAPTMSAAANHIERSIALRWRFGFASMQLPLIYAHFETEHLNDVEHLPYLTRLLASLQIDDKAYTGATGHR